MKPLRKPSSGMLRRAAMVAFEASRKGPPAHESLTVAWRIRPPEPNETPLSPEEMTIAWRIEAQEMQARAKANQEPLNEAGPRGEAWL